MRVYVLISLSGQICVQCYHCGKTLAQAQTFKGLFEGLDIALWLHTELALHWG